MLRRRDFIGSAALAVGLPATGIAGAYPDRPVQMVVGFPAGQASDIGARVLAARMGPELGQSVFVDNRAGAMGIIGHQFAKGAAADGYTVLYGSSGTLAINPALYRKLPYDPLKDFAPVVLLNSSPMLLVAANDTPVRSVPEMLAFARANRGKVNYGSSGNGATQHIAMEMLKKEAGIELLHVPYKGSPAMVTDLIAGRVQFAFDVSTSILPHVQAGRVRLLAVSSAERLPSLPDVPTVAEQGLPGFEALTWAALLVPAGTPQPVVQQLNAAANRALRSREVQEHFAKSESRARGGSPQELAAFLRQEVKKWGEAVAASGAQVD